jgi:TldD protein
MPNVSLQPGKEKKSVADMIKGVEKGIYIIGDGSFSIDQQRYNFQFGGQLFYEIKNGKIVGMLRKMLPIKPIARSSGIHAYGIADSSDYRLGGAFGDGKGQPPQSNSVSHGSSTARFNGVNVINTARNIG